MVRKIQEALGKQSLNTGDLPSLGKWIRGISPLDLVNMVEESDNLDDFVDVLSDRIEFLTSSHVCLIFMIVHTYKD